MGQDRVRLEELWRFRLEEAAKQHKTASENFRKALDEFNGQATALHEYRRILKVFTDLVVDRKMPPEE